MAFEVGKQEFTCPSCNALHRAKWDRLPYRDHETLHCLRCGEVLFSGKTPHAYHDLHLI